VIVPAGLDGGQQAKETALVRAHLVVIEGKGAKRPAPLTGQETHEARERREGVDPRLAA
jgi:hypothetical protein